MVINSYAVHISPNLGLGLVLHLAPCWWIFTRRVITYSCCRDISPLKLSPSYDTGPLDDYLLSARTNQQGQISGKTFSKLGSRAPYTSSLQCLLDADQEYGTRSDSILSQRSQWSLMMPRAMYISFVLIKPRINRHVALRFGTWLGRMKMTTWQRSSFGRSRNMTILMPASSKSTRRWVEDAVDRRRSKRCRWGWREAENGRRFTSEVGRSAVNGAMTREHLHRQNHPSQNEFVRS